MVNDASGFITLPVGVLQLGALGKRGALVSRKARLWMYYLSRGGSPCVVGVRDLGLILGLKSLGAVRKLRSELVAEGYLKKVRVPGKGWGYQAVCERMDGVGWDALLSAGEEEVPVEVPLLITPCWPAVFLPTCHLLDEAVEEEDLTLNEWWGALGQLLGHQSFSWIGDLNKPKTQQFWKSEIRVSLQKRAAEWHVRKLLGDPDTQVQTVLLGLARHIVGKGDGWHPKNPVAYMRGMVPRLGAARENLPLPDEEDVEDDMMILHEQGLQTLVDISQENPDASGPSSHHFR